ncbi:MAG: flagellar hook-basal body complex protein FliE [Deltaproteobacteria bacterium]|nr:flagellar hook-basal body complex protein FliE [Deltaproteobacteria bacterium]
MPIGAIQAGMETASVINLTDKTANAAPGFSDQMMKFLKEANNEMAESENISKAFAAGENNNIHETMIAAEKALVAFKLVGSVRNRVMEAYSEVMRMNV